MSRATSSDLSILDLQQMIRTRRRDLKKLEGHRARIQRKLDKVDRKIAALGGRASRNGFDRAGRGRAHNAVRLPEAIVQVLQRAGRPVGVGDIADKVQAGGYRSSSANFRGIVNQTLVKDNRFASAGRGVYQLKTSAAKMRQRGRLGKKPVREAALASESNEAKG